MGLMARGRKEGSLVGWLVAFFNDMAMYVRGPGLCVNGVLRGITP